MSSTCPLCGQALPAAIDENELQSRIHKLASPALIAEKKRLLGEYETQLTAEREIARQRAERQFERDLSEANRRAELADKEKTRELQRLEREHAKEIATERETARREAERLLKAEIAATQKRAEAAERERDKAIEQARHDVETRLQKEMAASIRRATRENEARLKKLQAERERDRMRFEAESAKLQGKLEDLSRKLEKQSGEQLGAEAELDLFTELRQAFPGDKVDRVGRGVHGADIVQQVMDATKMVGRIVYESKNTSDWHHSFVDQAKKYQSQYETPHVMIVTRVFPCKQKGLSVVKGVPVVDKRMAVALASVIREGIVEIARLRLSATAHEEKSLELFKYIVGDGFGTRFREIAEGVSSLRDQQQKERTWHEHAWLAESKIHQQIESRHREVDAQIRTIIRGGTGKLLNIAAGA